MMPGFGRWLWPATGIVLLWALLVLPAGLTGTPLVLFPLELPILMIGLALLPAGAQRLWRGAIVSALAVLTLLRLADAFAHAAFGRAFSPIAEWHLIGQGWTLAARTIGRNEAIALASVSVLILLLSMLLLWACLRSLARLAAPERRSVALICLLALGAGTLAALAPDVPARLTPRLSTGDELVHRANSARRAVVDQQAFSIELAVDPLDDVPTPAFGALAGRDVIALFIESYGRSWIDAERYRDDSRSTLQGIDAELRAAGLFVASTWVGSPVRGGRSWLAQATLASGLALTNQARFDRLLGSSRRPLHAIFRDAGWQTSVVLPIVQGEWVEGAWYDVDRFFDGPSLGYAGESFGYVTMPDQFTLSAFQRQVRDSATVPLFATVGLLGSHAPWTPLALPVDWDTIGDGAVFDGSHRFGDALDWARPEPVREMYGRSVELTLGRVSEYLQRHGRNALFLVLGDHQPATVIAGWAPDAAVPLHVITDDAGLLQRLDPQQFSTGMLPPADVMPLPMQSLREWLATRFEMSGPAVSVKERPGAARGAS